MINLPDDDKRLARTLFILTMMGVVAYSGLAYFLVS